MDLTWLGWLLVADIGFSALWKVSQVGKPRDPLSGSEAALCVLVYAAYIIGILTVGANQ